MKERLTLQDCQQLQGKGLHREAIDAYVEFLAFEPNYVKGLLELSMLYQRIGSLKQAQEYRSRYYSVMLKNKGYDIEENPQIIESFMASDGYGERPEQLPKKYVEKLFDDYSENFDAHLNETLSYVAPQQMREFILDKLLTVPHSVLDLGCGTGLAGAVFKDFASQLDGVDVSKRMLEKCLEKNIYDNLYHTDLVDYLTGTQENYDLIVATDVFNYLGDLRPAINACRSVQKSGGLLAFTAEFNSAGDTDAEYVLQSNMRYRHSMEAIQNTVADHGYQLVKHQTAVSRQDREGSVSFCYLLLQARDMLM